MVDDACAVNDTLSFLRTLEDFLEEVPFGPSIC